MLNNYKQTCTSTTENRTNKNRRIGKLLLLTPLLIILAIGLAALAIHVAPVRADDTIVDCPALSDGNSIKPDSQISTSTLTVGNTVTYNVTTPDKSPTGGVPGIIEYCVYPKGPSPTVEGDVSNVSSFMNLYDSWTAELNCNKAKTNTCVHDIRPNGGGNSNNIPMNGTNVEVFSVTYSTLPTTTVIALHINDADECAALFGGNPGTCFVFPTGGQIHIPPPSITKTVTPLFTRTFTWTITKTVDNKMVKTAGGAPATFNYAVKVTPSSTDSNFKTSGVITVTSGSGPLTGLAVTDSDSNGGLCTVSTGSLLDSPSSFSLASSAFETFPFSCTFGSNPGAGSDNATVTWPAQGDLAAGSATFLASYDFSSVSPALVDDSVTVTDTFGGPFSCSAISNPSGCTFTYSKTFTDPAGTCTSHDNTATFTTNTTGTKGSASQTVTDCQGADLTVSKSATPSNDWSISKAIDKTEIDIASGGTATFHYTITVDSSGWLVSGSITVSNPNDWEAITANVADAVDNGGSCTVTGGTGVSVPASGSVTLSYTCTYSAHPTSASGTNNATATWDKVLFSTPTGSASGSANFTFPSVTATDTLPDSTVVALGSCDVTAPCTFTDMFSTGGVAGTCTNYTDTAALSAGQSDSKTGKVCVGLDLTVSKSATPSFTRTFGWKINKSANGTSATTTAGSPATFVYTVTVSHDAGTDGNWKVTGTITVHNPNDWESITLTGVTDAVDNGGTCVVFGNTSQTIAANGDSSGLTYTCTYASAPSPTDGMNTATATWDASAAHTPSGSASGTAPVSFSTTSPTLVDTCVSVTDSQGGSLGSACVGVDPNPKTFTYTKTFNDPIGVCTSHTNTATFTTNDTHTSGSADLTVQDCQTGGFVSDTGFCNVPLTSTRIILTQDTTGHFGLTATNPGQYYYNFFFVGSASSSTTFKATIPFPFISQGANPFQVFNSALFPSCGGTVPGTNFNSLFSISPASIIITDYSPQDFTASMNVTFTVGSGGLPSGSYWFALHLNYGLKGFEYDKGTGTTCITAVHATGPSVTIGCPQSYTFSNSLSASSTITSVNAFYKDPGFLGTITNGVGTPIMNVQVRITVGGKPLVTVYTNQDGVYSYQYVYQGSKTTYSITASCMGASQTVSGSLTSKQLIVTNFRFN